MNVETIENKGGKVITFVNIEYLIDDKGDIYIDGKREIRDINMEFRVCYEAGIEAPERGECGYAR